jgi:amidophosphoribosyltransferase
VHVRISCPPTAYSCYYGVDTPHRQDLIASRMSVEEICEYIGADSLGYLSEQGMLESIGIDPAGACAACWTGKYPTLIAGGEDTIDPTDGGRTHAVEVRTNAA